jgi:pSer/pThr/pTyr-binding forkhead associated (FHA) protein
MRTGPTVGKVYPLDKNEIFIGRDLANDISINDPEVSRRHARVFLQGNNFVLEDLGSTNGTMVNGQKLMGPYMLRPGELIVLGEQVSLLLEAAIPDVDATIAAGQRVPETQIAEPSPLPVEQPEPEEPVYQPAYSGQVPAEQDFYAEEEGKKKFPIWLVIVIAIVLLVICACAIGIYFIDANDMWCQIFGFLFNAVSPGSCP